MRKAVYIFLLGVVLALPAAAAAKGPTKTLAPPGNSGVNQYVETVPTSKGDRPTSTIPRGGRPGSGTVSPVTAHALSSLGANGTGAAAFADATGTGRARTSQARASQKHKG